ncbi:NUDIX hydrolase [Psychromicrobium lacuslunae]|uniref:Nudix hydrolase domain-containing protein n=1 Tax=Psychromicrobium lacuslunae TaxID=1618207 RepID=A0A0D4BYB3_9MICC|nr:NUDIX domain-containing protein [Psychromicrobium lacuslunae]AJT41323.1 hypothetical protein UM93_06985 [Psychromicrobium lacuslunae]
MQQTVQVSAVAIFNQQGELLTVRKRGTAKFQLPGGKADPGETAEQAALREVSEEVGLELSIDQLSYLGHWLGEAANQDADLVSAEVFLASGEHQATAQAEIAELRWIPLNTAANADLAPLIALFLLPLLRLKASPASLPTEQQ